MKPLVVIPTYVREPEDMETTLLAVASIRNTVQGAVEVLLVDDGSPQPDLADKMQEDAQAAYGAETFRKPDNSGFSKTVNVGLRRALSEGRDAILMNADVEIITPAWLTHFQRTTDTRGELASVVGALLRYPEGGLIQHGGVYFSALTRTFDHLWKYAPANLPAALEKNECPVTGAFQFIRHETLTTVGIYDESFSMGWEDVDYCLRVMQEQKTCVYNPNVQAWHHEYMFRGRPSPKVAEWQAKSWMRLQAKWRDFDISQLVPFA